MEKIQNGTFHSDRYVFVSEKIENALESISSSLSYTRKSSTQTKINHKTGCVATVGILCAGLANFRKGGSASVSQRMMRMRVIAQGFTVAAFVAGAGAQSLFADDHVEENRRR